MTQILALFDDIVPVLLQCRLTNISEYRKSYSVVDKYFRNIEKVTMQVDIYFRLSKKLQCRLTYISEISEKLQCRLTYISGISKKLQCRLTYVSEILKTRNSRRNKISLRTEFDTLSCWSFLSLSASTSETVYKLETDLK